MVRAVIWQRRDQVSFQVFCLWFWLETESFLLRIKLLVKVFELKSIKWLIVLKTLRLSRILLNEKPCTNKKNYSICQVYTDQSFNLINSVIWKWRGYRLSTTVTSYVPHLFEFHENHIPHSTRHKSPFFLHQLYLVTGRIDRNAYSYSKGKQCLTLTVANKGLFENSECHKTEKKVKKKTFLLTQAITWVTLSSERIIPVSASYPSFVGKFLQKV